MRGRLGGNGVQLGRRQQPRGGRGWDAGTTLQTIREMHNPRGLHYRCGIKYHNRWHVANIVIKTKTPHHDFDYDMRIRDPCKALDHRIEE